jgi:hypothetical protein
VVVVVVVVEYVRGRSRSRRGGRRGRSRRVRGGVCSYFEHQTGKCFTDKHRKH